MQRRTYEKAAASLLGFGCMRLPTLPGGGDKIDRREAMRLLDIAYENGVTYFDTAFMYHGGESEQLVGEWVKTKPREKLQLATKYPIWMEEAGTLENCLAVQLKKLGTDYLDFYLLHGLSKNSWERVKETGLLPKLAALKQRGVLRKLGFSFHDDYPVFEEIIKAFPWDFCQIQLNYMDTEYQAGVKGCELAATLEIPVVVMEPVKGGSLANPPQEIAHTLRALHPDWSAASWALRWAASQKGVMTVLSGMSEQVQVQDNIQTLSDFEPLKEEELAALEKAGILYRARTKVSCTGCRYCMPCPAGVDIPAVFGLYNHAYIYNFIGEARFQYGQLSEKEKPQSCVACGKCMQKCPQHIEIPARLAEVREWAEKTLLP